MSTRRISWRRFSASLLIAVLLACIAYIGYTVWLHTRPIAKATTQWRRSTITGGTLFLNSPPLGDRLYSASLSNNDSLISVHDGCTRSPIFYPDPAPVPPQGRWDVSTMLTFDMRIQVQDGCIYSSDLQIRSLATHKYVGIYACERELRPSNRDHVPDYHRGYVDYDFLNINITNTLLSVYYRYSLSESSLSGYTDSGRPIPGVEKELLLYTLDHADLAAMNRHSDWIWRTKGRYKVCLRGRLTLLAQGGIPYILTGDNKLFRCDRSGVRYIADVCLSTNTHLLVCDQNEHYVIVDKDSDEILFDCPVVWRKKGYRNEHIRALSTNSVRDSKYVAALSKMIPMGKTNAAEVCQRIVSQMSKAYAEWYKRFTMEPRTEESDSAFRESLSDDRLFIASVIGAIICLLLFFLKIIWKTVHTCLTMMRMSARWVTRSWIGRTMLVLVMSVIVYALSYGPVVASHILSRRVESELYAPLELLQNSLGIPNERGLGIYYSWWWHVFNDE